MPNYRDVDDTFIEVHKAKFNLLIVTATKIEKDTLHEHLHPLPGQTEILVIQRSKYTYYVGVFGKYFAVHVSCNEMGSAGRSASLLTTSDAITIWAPTAVLMVGIAFGADEGKQKIGDVLVAECIQPYDPQRVGEKGIIMRGKEGPASSLLLDRFKSVTGWNFKQEDGRIPEIITGLLLSGEKLIDNPDFKAKLIAEYPEAKGGEMEGAGIYAACDQKVKDWILVKGICDFADGNKGTEKDKYQKMAIDSAVALCKLVFSKSYGLQEAGLVVQEDELKTDFSVEKGAIPQWMLKKERSLAKEIRHEE